MKILPPFFHLYKVNPKLFVFLLRNEQPQMFAFILSFCKNKSYVKRVLKLLDHRDEQYREYVIDYLNNCEKPFNQEIARVIEIYCEKMIQKYNNNLITEMFRKNFKIKKGEDCSSP